MGSFTVFFVEQLDDNHDVVHLLYQWTRMRCVASLEAGSECHALNVPFNGLRSRPDNLRREPPAIAPHVLFSKDPVVQEPGNESFCHPI